MKIILLKLDLRISTLLSLIHNFDHLFMTSFCADEFSNSNFLHRLSFRNYNGAVTDTKVTDTHFIPI